MASAWETIMSSSILYVILIHGVYGTFFPPDSNAPPIPSVAVRAFSNSPQTVYVQEDLPQDQLLPQPVINDEGLFLAGRKPYHEKVDDQRWYFQENQSSDVQSSVETFDRFYQSGEPAIGPVATPIPDDTFIAQSSSVSKLTPTDLENSGGSDIWFLTGGSDGQYTRFLPVQVPTERFVEVLNQDPGRSIGSDTVKSVVSTPLESPVKTQFLPNPPANIVQQVWVQTPNPTGIQKVLTNSPIIAEDIPSVKQVVDLPPANVKQIVQQQIVSDVPLAPLPPPAQVISKKSFSLPPPPPPPLKGIDAPPKVVSSVPANIIPDSNIFVPSKNIIPGSSVVVPGENVLQQVRHLWIPTSTRTGKFISIPVSGPINTDKSLVNKGLSLESTPVTVSDTWVLRQDGPIPSFEQQKSSLPSIPAPIVQSGKVLFQDPRIIQVDGPLSSSVITQVDGSKNLPIIEKSVTSNTPVNIWPARQDITSSNILNKLPAILTPGPSVASVKSEAVVIGKSFPVPPPFAPTKTVLTNVKAPIAPPIPPPAVQIVNDKPCPLPLPVSQKSLLPPVNPNLATVPRIIATQKGPFARIVRVNRYPTGSYYLLNRSIRPNYFTYPNTAVIQQPNTGLVRLVQAQPIPIQIPSKQPLPHIQTKQISIPVQSKQIVSPIPTKQVAFPFTGRQVIIPVSSGKSTRLVYPAQALRYAYPWNAYLRANPALGKEIHVSQLSPLKKSPKKADSSSSESSSSESSESSSDSSSEEKKEEKKKEEKKKEKKQSEESSPSGEREKESESNSKEMEDSNENSSKKESAESIETSESQMSLRFSTEHANARANYLSSPGTKLDEMSFAESDGSAKEVLATNFEK